MRRLGLLILLPACLSEGRAPSEPSAPVAPSPVEWSKAFAYDVEVEGSRLVVRLRVDDGFHVYTLGETVGKPLKLEVVEGGHLEDVRYPEGVTKDLPIGRSVIVEGSSEISGALEAESSVDEVQGRLSYQVCTDEACDRPRTATFTASVR